MTRRNLETAFPEETFLLAARMLRPHCDSQELRRLQQAHEQDHGSIRSAVPRQNLPGLGHPFWSQAQDHRISRDQHDEHVATRFTMVNTFRGQPLNGDQLHSYIHAWASRVGQQQILWQGRGQMSIYQPSRHRYEVVQHGGQPTVRLSLDGPSTTWQNGRSISQILAVPLYHATRSALVPSVLQRGLRCSPRSHGVVGVWCTSNAEMAFHWTINPMDAFPTATFQLGVDPNQMRRNAAICQGNVHRAAICDQNEAPLPNLALLAVYLRIPTQEHRDWQLRFQQTVGSAIQAILSSDQLVPRVTFEVWHLVNWRFCYKEVPTAMSPQFGGSLDQALPVSINLSIMITEVLWVLTSVSPRTRVRHCRRIPINSIPPIILTWLDEQYPGFSTLLGPTVPHEHLWADHPPLPLRRWSVDGIATVLSDMMNF